MLRFFRQIRQRLLTNNKFSKYLLYAIGEILLVVIGILLALRINNWNEWRKDRQTEKEIIQNLTENLEMILETLNTDVENLSTYNRSAQIVISVLDKKLPFSDSLSTHFHRARVPKFQLSIPISGYEQYKNQGFDIILNDRIKDEIITFFESSFPNWFNSYLYVNALNDSFIDYHVPLFHYKNQTLTPIDMQSLYTDQYFIGWISAYMEGRNSLIEYEKALIEETRRVLRVISEESDED